MGFTNAALDAADVGAVQAAVVGKALLREALLLSQGLEIGTDHGCDRAAREEAAAQSDDLRIKSLKSLDFPRPPSNSPGRDRCR